LAISEILVDECWHVSDLELYRGAYIVEPDNPGMILDDSKPTFQSAPMVVGHFQNKQVLK
jgi:hypothetical protein